MAERAVIVRLRAEVGNFQRDMQAAAASATATGTAAEQAGIRTQSGLRGLAASARQNEQAWNTAGVGLAAFGTAVVAGVGLSIAKFAEFDQAMSEVQASTHETSGNMDLLREAAVSAGADTAFSAKEAAQGIDELAKAGVSTKDILGGGLTGALSLAAAGSLGVGDAAELAATALTQFKLSGQDIPHLADLLAAGAGKAQGSVQDMGMALKQAGLVSASTGLSIEETTGGLAAFASAGLIGSDAGTSFKSMLQRLTPQSKEAQKAMDELGLSAYDSQGEFIGLAAFSGQLQNSMKDLNSESRNAAMGVIFGSDAVRAANVLYEQGATGVQAWIDAVDETGYAAITAAIKQDNLAGDIEKLGGSIDTALIKGGEGAAESLRGIVQSAEGFIDMLGKADPKLLQLGVGFAGVLGGVALLGGGFLTMLPKALAARAAFQTLQTTNVRLAGGLGKVGKSAGLAGAALLVVATAAATLGEKGGQSVEELNQALLRTGKSGAINDLSGQFAKWDTLLGMGGPVGVNSMADAVERLSNVNGLDKFNQAFDFIPGLVGAPLAGITQIEQRMRGLGDAMGALAANGGGELAAKNFRLLTQEFEKNGKGAQEALDSLPGYSDALLKLGNDAKVSLTPQELLSFAMGEVPQKMLDAQSATERAAAATESAAQQTEILSSGLESIGVSVGGTITSLDLFTQSLFAAGLLTLSARDAARGYEESLDSFSATIAKNGANLDINTAAGRENEAAINAITQAGLASAEAIAKDTAAYASNTEAQAAVQAALKRTYTDTVNSYMAMGKSKQEAEALTRATLNIPDEANIDTWMADTARAKAEETKIAIDNIPKKVNIDYVNTTTNRVINMAAENHIAEGAGGRGGLGRWMGGLVGFAGGGVVPGVAPSNPRVDNVLAVTQHGSPYKIRSGEMIVNEQATKQHYPLLKAINDGTYQAPSKSLAAGYGQARSVSGYAGRSTAPSVIAAAPEVRVFIGNKEIDARIKIISDISSYNAIAEANGFAGRRQAR